ncbi:MAG: XRE family transcriptional regulator [Anaerovoracaceae bacterium]
MKTGEKIKQLRMSMGLTQEELGIKVGVKRAAINKYETGVVVNIKRSTLQKLSEIFDVPAASLLDDSETSTKVRGLSIPVLGSIAAGIPIDAIEDIVDYEEIDLKMASTGEFFGLQIKGSSMEPRIMEGDVVIIRQQSDVESGEVAAVLVNGDEATLKKVVKHKNGISLISFNQAFEPRFFTMEEIESKPIKILGKVVELRGKF